ncbi:MAG TPA: phosphatase PAP2 family protein [Abditibacteriaceae bacterium]|nr:phosphatase PAP2 family protein [Abditibacteriaceae bacterium]
MRLFYLINGWAGRNEVADAAVRLFYVSAVPLLATVLAALLIFLPRQKRAPSRWRMALATALASGLCLGTQTAIESWVRSHLNTEILSPRPFVTHYTNLLVIEPNDNSFPCVEVMLAATLAVMIWAASATAGAGAGMAVLLLCGARMFCGSNYGADVGVGAALGACWGTLSLSLCRISIRVPLRDGRVLVWRARPQGVLSSGTALVILVGALFSFYGPLLRDFWHGSTATAAPAGSRPGRVSPREAILMTGVALPHNAEHEGGEGDGQAATAASPSPTALRSRAAGLDGHLPDAEKRLSQALHALRLPHRILGVEVAHVRAGNSAYRCAAVYFEVRASGVRERRRVAVTATSIVKRAFHIDSQLRNVDVVGAVLNDGSTRHASPHVFTMGEIPVFTASVPRDRLRLANGPRWLNWPGLDPGMWLRARSQLYINARVLPAVMPPMPQPTATPVPTPLPTAAPTAVAPAAVAPTAVPTKAAYPSSRPPPRPMVPLRKPSGTRKPVIKQRRPAKRVLPRPRLKRHRASGYRRPVRSRSSKRHRTYYRR